MVFFFCGRARCGDTAMLREACRRALERTTEGAAAADRTPTDQERTRAGEAEVGRASTKGLTVCSELYFSQM